MTDHPPYPYSDGSRAVLGPDVYASADGQTITWQGSTFHRHPDEAQCACGSNSAQTSPDPAPGIICRHHRDLAGECPCPPDCWCCKPQPPTTLRDLIAQAIWNRQHPVDDWNTTTDPWKADLHADADAVLAALQDHLDIGDAEAWCKTCRRVWDGPAHRCASDAEQRLVRAREVHQESCVLAMGQVHPTAFTCGVCDALDGKEQP